MSDVSDSAKLSSFRGQKRLFDEARCFFYITNDWEKPAEEIVFEANGRRNQENLPAQLKGDVRSLTAPVDNLLSNWAYMVMGSLAWSLKAWAALTLPENGRWQERHREEKQKLLPMDFTTFRAAMMNVPSQILSTGRRIVCRLLAWKKLLRLASWRWPQEPTSPAESGAFSLRRCAASLRFRPHEGTIKATPADNTRPLSLIVVSPYTAVGPGGFGPPTKGL